MKFSWNDDEHKEVTKQNDNNMKFFMNLKYITF